jgi:putative flippase GtrA
VTPLVREAARFGAVGVAQNGLNIAVFALATGAGLHYRTAAVLAGLLAFLASFALNRYWTFASRATPPGRQGLKYLIVFAAAIALGVGVLSLLVEVAGMAELPAQVVAILVVAPLSFAVQRAWVFERGGARAPRRSAAPRA